MIKFNVGRNKLAAISLIKSDGFGTDVSDTALTSCQEGHEKSYFIPNELKGQLNS